MKNIKNIFILLVILISFNACGSMKKAFQNEKKGNHKIQFFGGEGLFTIVPSEAEVIA